MLSKANWMLVLASYLGYSNESGINLAEFSPK